MSALATGSSISDMPLLHTSISYQKQQEIKNALKLPIDQREIPIKSKTKSAAKIFTSTTPTPPTKLPTLGSSESVISFCSGDAHSCVLFGSRRMKCAGYTQAFGVDSAYEGSEPSEIGNGLPYVNFGSDGTAIKVFCGETNTCLYLETNEVKCLGVNSYGQSGIGIDDGVVGEINGFVGDKLPVVDFGNGLQVLQFGVGNTHSCAKLTGNKVKCFGVNIKGQLGLGDLNNRGRKSSEMGDGLPFVDFGEGVEIASVITGSLSAHSCVILSLPIASTQRAKCWGWNQYLQLGYGSLFGQDFRGGAAGEMGENLPLVDFGTESRVANIVLGGYHSCAILINNALKCFGRGNHGQLGSGSANDISSTGNLLPSVTIDSGKTIKFLSTGNYHTCIFYDDMITVKCVGGNDYGQLGQGDTVDRGNSPTTIIPLIPTVQFGTGSLKIKFIHSGSNNNCVVFIDDSIRCFGKNKNAQFAIGVVNNIGDEGEEMGAKLKTSMFASLPTKAPTRNPSFKPTRSPTFTCVYPSKKKCKKDKKCIWVKQGPASKCTLIECEWLTKKKDCKKIQDTCIWVDDVCMPIDIISP